MTRMGGWGASVVGGMVLVGCSSLPQSGGGASVTGAELFEGVEARMMEGPVRLHYQVTAEGAFTADLAGSLRIDPGGVELLGEGTFGGAAVSLHLAAEGDSMEIQAADRAATHAAPPHLQESLVIGLTRMGILHNLARLTAGNAPDLAGGGVREWVEVREVRREEAGAGPEEVGIRFDIHVGGVRTADAVIWLDAATGLPVRREQVVRFPTGEMRVVERYRMRF